MTAKLTREEINKRLEPKGVTLLTEYVNSHQRALFRCSSGHERWLPPHRILCRANYICGECSKTVRSSKEAVNKQLEDADRTIRLIGEYKSAQSKSLFRCICGHEWHAKPSWILNSKRGCPVCSDTTLSKEIVNHRLREQGRNIKMIGEYVNNYTRSLFRCSDGHEWQTEPGNVLRATGCPTCAEFGFKPNKPAHLYIIKYPTFIKYGIANNLEQRLEQHRKWGDYTVIHTCLYETGTQAKNVERHIKQTFGGSYVGSEIMGNGWTETLASEQLNALLETVRGT